MFSSCLKQLPRLFKKKLFNPFWQTSKVRILMSSLLVASTIQQANSQHDSTNNAAATSMPASFNLTEEAYMNVSLPPLEAFLQTAETSPGVLRSKAYVKEQEYRMNVTKKEWLNYIRANANYSYGSMGSMTESSATGQGTYFQFYGEVMSLYNIGGSITFPLDFFFGRLDRIKANKSQVDQAKYQTLQEIETRKIQITELYASVLRNLSLLKITAEAKTVAESNVKMGEMEYINGSTTLQVLSGQRRDLTLAASSYEDIKSELFKAILTLELITGIKILN
jgi:outer membrane protein TolC